MEGQAEYAICDRCLTVQKLVTPEWEEMAARIYDRYDINHQSEGAEPTIFDTVKGSGPRSEVLLLSLFAEAEFGQHGSLLDVGCSNGNLIRSFHKIRPDWKLSGSELTGRWAETVLRLPGVERFYTGADPSYDRKFDLITLSHVVEHVHDPIAFLRKFVPLLTPGGRILVVTPDVDQNAFDLLIADHCTHFDENSLGRVALEAGFHVDVLSKRMLPKELVLLLSVPAGGGSHVPPYDERYRAAAIEKAQGLFALLEAVRAAAACCVTPGRSLGLMGSSITACWTMLELDGRVDFFVDEDSNRIGRSFMGRPILAPGDVPAGAVVFVPMTPAVAGRIAERWRHRDIEFKYVT